MALSPSIVFTAAALNTVVSPSIRIRDADAVTVASFIVSALFRMVNSTALSPPTRSNTPSTVSKPIFETFM